jgi:hypothetical protein
LPEAGRLANHHNSKYRYSNRTGGNDVLKGLAFGAVGEKFHNKINKENNDADSGRAQK